IGSSSGVLCCLHLGMARWKNYPSGRLGNGSSNCRPQAIRLFLHHAGNAGSMKILFSSYLFHPSIGGIESVSKILAEKFAEAGHEVHLITQTRGEQTEVGSYRITRRPSLIELTRLLRWCDLLFQNNISLRNLIPALVLRKRTLVAHHTWIQDVRGQIRLRDRIK